jgi:hypothetical protein
MLYPEPLKHTFRFWHILPIVQVASGLPKVHARILKRFSLHSHRIDRQRFIDNDPSYGLNVLLLRVNKYTGDPHIIYEVWTSGDSSSIRQLTDAAPGNPAYALVNNDVCAYYVGIVFAGGSAGTDRMVYGITINYE